MNNKLLNKINKYFSSQKQKDESIEEKIENTLLKQQYEQQNFDETLRQQFQDLINCQNKSFVQFQNESKLVLPPNILDPLLNAQNQKILNLQEHNKNQSKQISIISQSVQLLLAENTDLRKRIKKQQKKFQDVCENMRQYQNEIQQQFQQENELFKQQNQLFQQQNEKLEEENKLKLFHNETIQKQLDELLQDNQNLKDQIKSQQLKEKEQAEKIITKDDYIDTQNEQIFQLQKQQYQIDMHDKRYENLNTKFNKLGLHNYENINDFIKEIADSKEKAEFQIKQIRDLEEKLSSKQQLALTYQEQNNKLKNQYQKLDKQFFQLKSQYTNSINNNKILKQQLQNLKNQDNLSQLPQNQKIQQLTNEKTQLQVNFQDLKEQYEVLQNKLLYLEKEVVNQDQNTNKQYIQQIEQQKTQINIKEDMCTEKDVLIQQLQKEIDDYQMEKDYFLKNMYKINDFEGLQKNLDMLQLQLQKEKESKQKKCYEDAIQMHQQKQELKKKMNNIVEQQLSKINELQDQNIDVCKQNLELKEKIKLLKNQIIDLQYQKEEESIQLLGILKNENYEFLHQKLYQQIQSQFGDNVQNKNLQQILQNQSFLNERNNEVLQLQQIIKDNEAILIELDQQKEIYQKEQQEKQIKEQQKTDKLIQTDNTYINTYYDSNPKIDFLQGKIYTQEEWLNKKQNIKVNSYKQQQNLEETIRYQPKRVLINQQTPKKVTFAQHVQVTNKKKHRNDCATNKKHEEHLECDRFNCYCENQRNVQNLQDVQPINLSNLPFIYYDK